MMSEAESQRLYQRLVELGGDHVESILIPTDTEEYGLGSTTIVSVEDRIIAISCKHVLDNSHGVLFGAVKSDSHIPDNTCGDAVRHVMLAEMTLHPSADVGFFDITDFDLGRIRKKPYDLSRSDMVKKSKVRKITGTSLGCRGNPAFMADLIKSAPDQLFAQLASYTTFGPVTGFRRSEIIADCSEMHVVARSPIHDLSPTGGIRNIKGMSGAGCWMECNDEFRLIGILAGRIPEITDKHMIRVVPIWEIRNLLGV